MSRINTNVTSLIAQRVLRKNNDALSTSLERLSTGLKINKGQDNPAGLIASENLRSEKTGITQAIDNSTRASNLIGTAEGGLGEVSSLLNEVQGLVGQSANTGGLSNEELAANQLQVDSILNTINRIAQSTSFEGKKLLNGNYDYTTNAPTNAANVRINSARLPDGQPMAITAVVATSASTARYNHAGVTTMNNVIEVAGNLGSEQVGFASGASQQAQASAINAVKTSTGVSASLSTTGDLRLDSMKMGVDQFISLKVVSGTDFAATKKVGVDAVVAINGAAASVKGSTVSFRNNSVDIEFDLTAAGNVAGGNANFTVTGGGANFALGSKVTETNKASLGIASVSTSALGDATTGFLSSLASGGANSLASSNGVTAQTIIDKAVKQVSQLRGRLGAFQKFTLGSTINSLGVAFENASAAESAIRDTEFASETANMTRSQILSQAATTVLAQANSSPQSALTLLRGG